MQKVEQKEWIFDPARQVKQNREAQQVGHDLRVGERSPRAGESIVRACPEPEGDVAGHHAGRGRQNGRQRDLNGKNHLRRCSTRKDTGKDPYAIMT